MYIEIIVHTIGVINTHTTARERERERDGNLFINIILVKEIVKKKKKFFLFRSHYTWKGGDYSIKKKSEPKLLCAKNHKR